MPRGRVWAVYVADDGRQFAVRVDADYAADPARGWTTTNVSSFPVLPRGFRPRAVHGEDAAGNHQHARIGSTSAPLWTGSATTFTIETTDQQLVDVDVRSRTDELERAP